MLKWATFCVLSFLIAGCVARPALSDFKNRCERSGGVYMDCAAAFSEACSRAQTIEGKNVICSCPEGTEWDAAKGCKKY